MLGNAFRAKTSNWESFAHWPTQRFETIAHAGRPVAICNGAPFREFLPVFRLGQAFILANRLVCRQCAPRTVSQALQKGAESAFLGPGSRNPGFGKAAVNAR